MHFKSILLILLLPYFINAQQQQDCEVAFENATCGIDEIIVNGIADEDNHNYFGFVATATELDVLIEWNCIEAPGPHSVLYTDCGNVLETSPQCDGFNEGFSDYAYEDLVVGETYVLDFEACDFPCTYYSEIFMDDNTQGFPVFLQEPFFLETCQATFGDREFCANSFIQFEAITPSALFAEQTWSIEGLSNGTDPDDAIWETIFENGGNGQDISFVESPSIVNISIPTEGEYRICLESTSTDCLDLSEACVDITITPMYRDFGTHEICLSDLEGGWTPPTNQDGLDWLSPPFSLADLNSLDNDYVVSSSIDECATCEIQEIIHIIVSYPDGDNCTYSAPQACPNWNDPFELLIDGLPAFTTNLVFAEENSTVSIRSTEDFLDRRYLIEWYRNDTPDFIPGEKGTLAGISQIGNNVDACTYPPEILSVVYDGYFIEDANGINAYEMAVLGSGSGFKVSELSFESDEATCDTIETCRWINPEITESDCANLISVGPDDLIPANSYVVVLISPVILDQFYLLATDVSYCEEDCIYVTQYYCPDCIDLFPADGDIVEVTLKKESCVSVDFEYRTNITNNFVNYVTKEGIYGQSREYGELPPALLPEISFAAEVEFAQLELPCQDNLTTYYVRGLMTDPAYSRGCCSNVTNEVEIQIACSDTPQTSINWVPLTAIPYLPPDITVETDICPFSFEIDGFIDESGQPYPFASIVAQSNCGIGGIDISFENVQDAYSAGQHDITYFAKDQCGNVITHSFTLNINCNSNPGQDLEIFTTYPWLNDLLDPSTCEDGFVDVYELGSITFIYVHDGDIGTLYLGDGTQYCQDYPGFVCFDAYGLSMPDFHYQCGLDTPPAGPSPVDEYPWMVNYIDFNNCAGTTIEFYDFYGTTYPYFEANGQWTLFSNTGQVWCTDNGPSFICPEVYNLGAPIDTWECTDVPIQAPCGCLDVDAPVCGSDGVTYQNDCVAFCAGITDFTIGACSTDTLDEIFITYDWLLDIVDPFMCEREDVIEVYLLGSSNFLYVNPELGPGTLYDADGNQYCQDYSGFRCLDAYGLTNNDVIASWECNSLHNPDEVESRSITESKEQYIPSLVVKTYPNPTTEFINIQLGQYYEAAELFLWSLDGLLITNQKIKNTDNHKLDLSSQAKGLYLLKVIVGQQSKTEKIILI